MKDAEILMLCKAQLVAILDSDSPLSKKQGQASKLGTKLRQQLREAGHPKRDAIDLSVRVVGVAKLGTKLRQQLREAGHPKRDAIDLSVRVVGVAIQEHIQRLKDEGKLNGSQA